VVLKIFAIRHSHHITGSEGLLFLQGIGSRIRVTYDRPESEPPHASRSYKVIRYNTEESSAKRLAIISDEVVQTIQLDFFARFWTAADKSSVHRPDFNGLN
jgi:hypothetical protein